MDPVEVTRHAVHAWVDAFGTRDVDAVLATLDPSCVYCNVGEPARVGHAAIRPSFTAVMARADRVAFEVVTESYAAGTGWVERVDRFWIDGTEHALPCNGVFRVDVDTGLIVEVRDYLDITGWRQQMAGVL